MHYKYPWWISPGRVFLFVVLPVFLLTVTYGDVSAPELKQQTNNINDWTIFLGILSLVSLSFGSLLAAKLYRPGSIQFVSVNIYQMNRVMLFLATLSLLANFILFSGVATKPELFFKFLLGDPSAMYEIRRSFNSIAGVTSLVSLAFPFFCLYCAVRVFYGKQYISRANHLLFIVLFSFTVIRAIFGSERLALLEAIFSTSLLYFCIRFKDGWIKSWLPYIGGFGVFGLFAVGEYFRSWQAYKVDYDSFSDFVLARFFGYFVTSVNNGAGRVTYYEPFGYPVETTMFWGRLLGKILGDPSMDYELHGQYLEKYGSLEFNNPGGLYAAYMDYGVILGATCLIGVGFIGGALYSSFIKSRVLGVMLYPLWFLGGLDIIRIWYWGDSRFFPVIAITLIAYALGLREWKRQ